MIEYFEFNRDVLPEGFAVRENVAPSEFDVDI